MSPLRTPESLGSQSVARRFAGLIVIVASMVAVPALSFAQTGTLTDDAYAAASPVLQQGNLGGNGPAIVVAGPGATLAGVPVGVANGYIKFKLTSIVPPGTTDENVARATLRLYASSLPTAGSVVLNRITGTWNENTVTTTTALTLTPEASAVKVARAQSFVTFDVTKLVKDWLSGKHPNDGVALVAAGDRTFVSFDSKESAITSHEPSLEIALVNQGPKGLNWKGAWAATTEYVADDAVTFDGSSWRALRANSNSIPVEGNDWTIIAQKGDAGSSNSGVSSVTAASPISVSNPTTTPAISLGVVPVENGGTGLSAPGLPGTFLRSGGGAWVSTPLTAPDVPPGSGQYIQNSSALQSPAQFNIAGNATAAIFDATTQFNVGGNRILGNPGTDNMFAGVNAGISTATGVLNTFVGASAGLKNNSNLNTFVGAHAGENTDVGGANSFFGVNAGFQTTSGIRNSFFGGTGTGFTNTTGNSNTFVGSGAGFASTTGSNNSFFGDKAGNDNTTGSDNVFIGSNSGNPNSTTQVNNSVAIGTNAVVSTSNTIVLGTAAQVTQIPGQLNVTGAGVNTFATAISGLNVDQLVIRRFGSGQIPASPAPVCFRLGIATGVGDGGAGLTTCTGSSSSIRYKTDLQPFLGGLDLISRLKPTQFTWKASKETDAGLIAEQVAEVAPIFTYTNDKGEIDGVKYANLSVVFINAINEQQKQLLEQRTVLQEQDKRLQSQQQQIDRLTDFLMAVLLHEREERK